MTGRAVNPWQKLPLRTPYVLPEDADLVTAFNEGANENTFLHLELLPEPFLGDPDAPIVVLNSNPGFEFQQTASS